MKLLALCIFICMASLHAVLEESYTLFKNNNTPLFSFGQNIIRKNQFWAQGTFFHTKTSDGKLNEYQPAVIYGLTDDFSLYALLSKDKLKQGSSTFTGVEDFLIQGEYALHQHGTQDLYTLISVIGGIYAPTSKPPLDRSTTHFFLGSTQVYITNDYYIFGSFGDFLPATRKTTRYGHTFLYQMGLGKTIHYTDHYFLAFLSEFDGFVVERNYINKIADPNSGSHTFWAGPVIYLVTGNFIFQAGMQWPLYQKINGIQSKFKHIIGTAISYYRQF